MHLDIAYPAYEWLLLFHNRQFRGLMRNIEVDDTTRFNRISDNEYRVTTPFMSGRTRLEKGDIIRLEQSNFDEVHAVKSLIESRLHDRQHSNIIYHYGPLNLSNYTDNEIDSLYTAR